MRLKATYIVLCWLTANAWGPGTGRAQSTASALTLEGAVQRAITVDERVRVGDEDHAAAVADLDQARAFFFPEVTLSGSYTRRPNEVVRIVGGSPVIIQRFNALAGLARIRIPLFDAQAFPLYRHAALLTKAQEWRTQSHRYQVGFEAAHAYLLVLTSAQVQRAASRRLDFAQERLRDADARSAAGLTSSNDVTRGALEVQLAKRQWVVAAQNASAAAQQLAYLMAMDKSPVVQTPTALEDKAKGIALDAVLTLATQGLGKAPAVRAVEIAGRAAEELAKEPLRRLVPDLEAVGQGTYTNETGFNGRSFNGTAALVATWALFDGGVRYAQARKQDALARAAHLQSQGQKRAVERDLHQAAIALQGAREARIHADESLRLAGQHAEESAQLYRRGLTGALVVAEANALQFDAEITVAQDRLSLLLAYLDLQAAAGDAPPGFERRPEATPKITGKDKVSENR